ncbi:MAG: endolytic transglycosylase MltG [Patescibacteria group bacterium]|nr:endolytic transglycosylase MltG [Patescibacteria group bacterium]
MKKYSRLILLSLVVLAAFLLGGYAYYKISVTRTNYGQSGLAEFVVRPGEHVYEIADELRQAQLINSASAFKLYVRLHDLESKLQAGYYRLPRTLSIVQIVDVLQHGKFDVRLTFPEGWRREEMADYAARQLADPSFYEDFLKASQGLDGYLFPDTYIVPHDIKAADLVRVMNNTFKEKYSQSIGGQDNSTNLSQKDIIILSSIVEREARKDEDRPIIAGILLKRLQSGWPLEADATVQYAVASQKLANLSFENLENFEFWPGEISLNDLKIDSPYNTRQHLGLPPSPICNPGLPSIKAVYQSVETPYWFYLTDKQGITHFAQTLAEHNRNIQKYLTP